MIVFRVTKPQAKLLRRLARRGDGCIWKADRTSVGRALAQRGWIEYVLDGVGMRITIAGRLAIAR